MKPSIENFFYGLIKLLGFIFRVLPESVAIWIGRTIGLFVYYFDVKHKALAYGNLKIAFAKTKTPNEIKKIIKELFINFGQNIVELFRLPLLNSNTFEKYVKVEGREHIDESLKKGKGVILLAMHFGSWELASLSCAMFGRPYKVIVKPQKKFSKLDELLNSYRSCGGNVVLSKGLGTREIVKSLRNNEIIGMVVDQGGKDGTLIPFFGRGASMFVGAIRIGLKFGVPICFTIIIRDKGPFHRMIVHKPLELIDTGNIEEDVVSNLKEVMKTMEHYIVQYPAEYMWFYKIWKYSKDTNIVILSDDKTGHLRQSQLVANMIQKALSERNIVSKVEILNVSFKNKKASRLLSVFSFLANAYIYQGRLELLKWFLTKESFKELVSTKADFIVSCGSSVAGINYLLSNDQRAKSVAILKPGILAYKKFDLVVLPQHDQKDKRKENGRVVITQGAPNIIDQDYLNEQKQKLLSRYSHLKFNQKLTVGLLIGGDTKNYVLNEQDMRLVINQIKEVSEEINADILVTTSRRTSQKIEGLVHRELKQHPRCRLVILATQNDVPEAMGGILGLSDIVVVSGDSISMISEAASSGKKTIVFPVQNRSRFMKGSGKHNRFIEALNAQGYIVSSDARSIGQTIYNVGKNKIQTQKLNDNPKILEAVRYII